MSRSKISVLLTLLAALALGLSACGPFGDDDDESSDNASQSSTTTTQEAPASPDAEPVAEIDTLTGISTEVAFDQGFVDALGDLELEPGVVGDAEFTQNGGAAKFPITGGNVTYFDPASDVRPYVQGEIIHDGSGLSLSSEGTTVELTDFNIDPGESTLTGTVTANGEVAAEDALLFNLDGTTLEPLKVNENFGAAVLEGTTVVLSEPAAQLLNDTFGTDALAGGFTVGESKITVALPES